MTNLPTNMPPPLSPTPATPISAAPSLVTPSSVTPSSVTQISDATPASAQAHLVPDTGFDPAALILAILLPGLGHFVRRQKSRGVAIAVGVLGMFFGGILIGGIDVVDSREDRIWFLGQAMIGPIAFATDYYHQSQLKVVDPSVPGNLRSAYPNEGRNPITHLPVPGGKPPNTKSISRINELGTLFSTIAGMLNLIVIIDAAFPSRRRLSRA